MILNLNSEFLENLAAHASKYGRHLPTLEKLTNELDLHIQSPREQL